MDIPYSLSLPDGYGCISPFDLSSIASVLGTMGTPSAATWPTTNLAIAIPFRISRSIVLSKAWWYNGATVSYNVDVGIYSADWTKLGSIGSTAQGSASVIVSANLTTEFGPGLFYLAMAMSNALGTAWRSSSMTLSDMRACGCAQMASALALPANFTPAAIGQAYVPVFGVTVRSVV